MHVLSAHYIYTHAHLALRGIHVEHPIINTHRCNVPTRRRTATAGVHYCSTPLHIVVHHASHSRAGIGWCVHPLWRSAHRMGASERPSQPRPLHGLPARAGGGMRVHLLHLQQGVMWFIRACNPYRRYTPTHTHTHTHAHTRTHTHTQGDQHGGAPMLRCSACTSLTHPGCDGQAEGVARVWQPGQMQPDFFCAHCRLAQLSQIDQPHPKLRVRMGAHTRRQRILKHRVHRSSIHCQCSCSMPSTNCRPCLVLPTSCHTPCRWARSRPSQQQWLM